MSDISLEIHHLDVRGGDATAVIVKEHNGIFENELYRVLIDAGSEGKGSSALKFYLETYLPGPFDLVVATHYHQDHIQGFSQANIVFKQFLDNGSYPDGYKNLFKPRNDIGKGARTSLFHSYSARVQTAMVPDPKKPFVFTKPTRVPIDFIEAGFNLKQAKPVEIELGAGTGIKLICYCANGILANGENVLDTQKSDRSKAISPNDVSIAMIIQWGEFRYFTAGDLSGDEAQSSYYNIEKHLVDYLVSSSSTPPGPLSGKKITVLKASHHGSEHSTQSHLLEKLQPDTIVVCCNMQKQVPSPVFLTRLKEYFDKNTSSRVVFTNTMKVFKADDRYDPLAAIANFITPTNVEFTTAANKFASNLKVKCAVIRRRVRDGSVVTPEMPTRPCGRLWVPAFGYDIVLMDRDAEDEKKLSAAVRFKQFDWRWSWNYGECDENMIFKQFDEQATEMNKWLLFDEDARKTTTKPEDFGRLYMADNYPALLQVVEDATDEERIPALLKKMKEMFAATFTLNKLPSGWLYQPKANQLTSDEKKSIFLLLWGNLHQVSLNKVLNKLQWDPTQAWNAPGRVDEEPYLKRTAKRALTNPVPGRGPKKKK